MLENKTYIIEQLNNRRDAISGVSLDEEMTNMIRYQHAYTAAARVINVMDEMMDVLVNKLGMVGR
ncbi:MAG: flagellar basal body rod C-terminal domain-containing protein [Peptococcia bacterium]